MKKILKFCSKSWHNAILNNAFLPTGMIPYNVIKANQKTNKFNLQTIFMKKIFNNVKKHLRSLLEIQGELLMRGNLTN